VYTPTDDFYFTENVNCGSGMCNTYWRENDHDLMCNNADGYLIEFVLQDDDGNQSAPYELVLRDI